MRGVGVGSQSRTFFTPHTSLYGTYTFPNDVWESLDDNRARSVSMGAFFLRSVHVAFML